MAYDNKNYNDNQRNNESVFSKKVKAGKRRTYFFDVKATRANDYFITITESKKRFEDDSYSRHKMFLYKEDFNKFADALVETVNYVKTELMPNFYFDAYNYSEEYDNHNQKSEGNTEASTYSSPSPASNADNSDVDNWKM